MVIQCTCITTGRVKEDLSLLWQALVVLFLAQEGVTYIVRSEDGQEMYKVETSGQVDQGKMMENQPASG